jgi:hypothetical protein
MEGSMTTGLDTPQYDIDSAALRKYRKMGPVKEIDPIFRRLYGAAVEDAVLAKQRAALKREVSLPSANCASGTWHSDGESISKAVRAQHRAATQSWPSRIRKARKPHEWQAMYDEAMQEKRGKAA